MATIVNARGQHLQTDTATTSNTAGGTAAGDTTAAAATTTAGKTGLGDADSQPLSPPAPMIGHLTNEEIDALNDVFSRMEMFEAEESARIRYNDVVVVVVVVVAVSVVAAPVVVKVFKPATRRSVGIQLSKRRVKLASRTSSAGSTA